MSPKTPGIETILAEAVEIPDPAGRAAYLDRACGGDAVLRARVGRMADDHFLAGSFLEHPPVAALPDQTAPFDPGGVAVGTRVGPYTLRELLGEGGMGAVYVAEQAEPVKRRVALKVIKPGMDSKQVVARFEAERQALALMDHPNIAKILDGGTTETGRPFFVMELVRGVPITEYCDRAALTTRQRLELFVQVCAAVQHAHQKGVIHRDLKPSNVLVTLYDGRPVPKVIDFGVAKAVGARLTDHTVYTGFVQLVGTPLYMSPEQAEMSALDVDTRADVYALGVLLYELLTGVTPFDAGRFRGAGFDEVRRIIREDEPPRPSQRLSTLAAEVRSTASARRGVDGRRLAGLLRGELDWVVMKCLEKDRERRYESVSALAADVQRFLSEEPVEACPPSAGYRLRKFWRRNQPALLTAGVVALTLLAATAVSAWQAVRATDAQHGAEAAERQAISHAELAYAARRVAVTESRAARAVNDFLLEDLLGQADGVAQFPNESGGNPDLTVKESLERASARIGERFRDDEPAEMAIRTTIGTAYIQLYRPELAIPHLERALALQRTHRGPDRDETHSCIYKLGGAYAIGGRPAESIALFRQMVEYSQSQHGPDNSATLAWMTNLAEAYRLAGQYGQSVPLLEQVLQKQRAINGPTAPSVRRDAKLGDVKVLDGRQLSTLHTMYLLARNYMEVGRFPESVELLEAAIRDDKTPRHLQALAQACQKAGQLDRAEQLLREALDAAREGKDTFSRRNFEADTLGLLATNRLLRGRYEEAESFARSAVALDQKDSFRHFEWVGLLGAVLVARQEYAEAESLLLRAHEGMKKREAYATADQRQRLHEAAERVARLYEATGRPDKAREWREKVPREVAPPPRAVEPKRP